MNPIIIIILIAIGITVLSLVLKYLASKAVDKTSDAIRNAKAKSDMAKNPPKQESLAERYKK